MSEEVETLSITSHAIYGGISVSTLIISMLSTSSPSTVWIMANQLQLFSLLLLTKSDLPNDIIRYITSSDYLSFSMNFLPISNIRKLLIILKF